jgi:threonyl-tRNA synthetase
MLVIGDREQSDGAVSVRSHDKGELGSLAVDEFAQRLQDEVASR